MISAVRTTKHARGFTLIEIVMVLAIAAIVMGGAVGLMVYSSDERELRNASGEIELMAKRARTIAILHQTPYALEFREGIVRLLPLAQAGMDLSKKSRLRNDPEPAAASTDESRQFVLENGMTVSIRRWNSQEWHTTLKDTFHVWRFDPDGLCEPISVRLNLDKSWAEDTYHPLTATIRDSQLEAR
jgi:prepilin-type N-terminal cleavage/methylation domain-containing protein